MFSPLTIILATAASLAVGSASAGQISVSGNGCEVIRILEDGREVRSMPANNGSTRVSTDGGNASAVSVRSSSGSSHSSVSVSSSSSGNSTSSARAVSSTTDADGRTVTTTRDENGCTIVIDERDN